MVKKQRTSRNALMVATQVVISGITLFVLYRYLLETIGVVQLGVWSVVLATVSASRISELGLSGSVVKFVAKYLARSEPDKSAQIIETAALSIGLLIGSIILLVYPVLTWALGYFVPENNLPDALNILPYALICLWLMALVGVFQSGLEGCQRFDLRSLIIILSQFFYLGLTFLLVPLYGLIGLALAQVAQSIVLFVVNWFVLRNQLTNLALFPYHWSYPLFREMLGYGVNFQIISVAQLLFEPTTKALLSKFGGLSMVGYYEMANKMILQFRSILVTATQVVVPQIATIHETNQVQVRQIYRHTYAILLYISLPFYAGIAAVLPLIGEVWIGHYEPVFVSMGLLLTIGRFFNSISAPVYFAYLGTGRLRWNTLAHITIGVLNVGLGYALGIWLGGMGVVLGTIVALIVGSAIYVIAYHLENNIHFLELLPKENQLLIIASGLGATLTLLIYHRLHSQLAVSALFVLCLLVFLSITFPPAWYHHRRLELMKWITK